MRNLVQPPPSLHCELCKGELRYKRTDPEGPFLELESQVFVCIKCGHELAFTVRRDRYAAHSGSDKPPVKAG